MSAVTSFRELTKLKSEATRREEASLFGPLQLTKVNLGPNIIDLESKFKFKEDKNYTHSIGAPHITTSEILENNISGKYFVRFLNYTI